MKNNDTSTESIINSLPLNQIQEEGNKSNKNKIVMIIVILIILVAIAIGTFYMNDKYKKEAEEQAKIAIKKQEEAIFTDVEDIIVNLDTRGKGISFLKLRVSLQVKGKSNSDNVVRLMPKIRDTMQTYLRELRPSDLVGSYGLYKLREELLLRINSIVYPTQVDDLLFKDVLIQ